MFDKAGEAEGTKAAKILLNLSIAVPIGVVVRKLGVVFQLYTPPE